MRHVAGIQKHRKQPKRSKFPYENGFGYSLVLYSSGSSLYHCFLPSVYRRAGGEMCIRDSSGESPFPFSKRKQKFPGKGFICFFGIPKGSNGQKKRLFEKICFKMYSCHSILKASRRPSAPVSYTHLTNGVGKQEKSHLFLTGAGPGGPGRCPGYKKMKKTHESM